MSIGEAVRTGELKLETIIASNNPFCASFTGTIGSDSVVELLVKHELH
jgi:hypothetical protein